MLYEVITEQLLELADMRFDDHRFFVDSGERLLGFQAVARNADDRELVGFDAPLLHQFLGDAHRHAACGFREDALGFRQQLHCVDDFRIGDILAVAAAFFSYNFV